MMSAGQATAARTCDDPRTWLAIYAGLAAAAVVPVVAWPSRFMLDDPVFYLQVGHWFASTLRSTFNGVELTNGYHPLWMLVCAALSLVTGHDKPLLLPAATFAQLALFGGIAALTIAALRPITRSWWWSLVPLTAYFWGALILGSEAFLNGLLLVLFAWLGTRPGDSIRRQALIGVVLGLCVLARLDNIFVACGYAGARLWIKRPVSRELIGLSACAAVAAAVVAPYLATNLVYFGHLVPVSGAIKSALPHFAFDPRAVGKLGLVLTAISAGSLAVAWRLRTHPSTSPLAVPMAALNAGTILLTLYLVTATRHQTVWHWSYVPAALNLALVLPVALDFVRGHAGRRLPPRLAGTAGIVALVVALSPLVAKNWVQAHGWAEMWYERDGLTLSGETPWPEAVARSLDARLPAGTRILVFDHPGYLAYFSRLAVIPSDGLMMNFESDASLRQHGIDAFLRDAGVRHLLLPSNLNPGHSNIVRLSPARTPDGLDVQFFSPLTGEDVGTLRLSQSCRTLDLSALTSNPFARWLEIGLWTFPCQA